MATTTSVRLFEVDPWVGPRLKAYKIDNSLLKIKPPKCRILIRRQRHMDKLHGPRVEGIHFSNGHHTIIVVPMAEKESIAHELGHAALNHKALRSGTYRTAEQQIRRELAAWNWAAEHWAKPNHIKTGVISERKKWIGHVVFQTMHEEKSDIHSTLLAVKKQMKELNMPPLTESEALYIIRDAKKADKYLRETGWEPEYSFKV